MRTPVQSRSESSADRMVTAAVELAQVGGLQAVTIAAVAERSETSNGALYHRFGGRIGLLLAAQDRVLSDIERATGAAFASAEKEPDDERAVRSLTGAALNVFTEYQGAMRAFLVEARYVDDAELFSARMIRTTHALARVATEWLIDRFSASTADAEAAWRILLALGASRALLDDDQFSARSLGGDDFADSLVRSLLAVARAPTTDVTTPSPE